MHATMNPNLVSMLDKFDGCEGGDPGTPANPSIWLFGIEPGWSKRDQANADAKVNPMDDGYSVDTQLGMPYNLKAFKLFAAINKVPVSQYKEFAKEYQPFVQGSKGYFKGNLYPYACNKVSHWPQDAVEETGLESKNEYQKWCKEHRWPAISRWVSEHQPKILIGVGITFLEQFSLAVLGRDDVELDCYEFSVNGYVKRIFSGQSNGQKLVVIPHLTGGPDSLNSDESILNAGNFIRDLIAR